jgi:hypothetical protein
MLGATDDLRLDLRATQVAYCLNDAGRYLSRLGWRCETNRTISSYIFG